MSHPQRPLFAPPATSGLRGTAKVMGDKSISHRALLLGALAIGRTRIVGLLEGDDVLATARAVRALGAGLSREGDGTWLVDGVGIGGLAEPEDVIDMGNAGTGARLLMGVLASQDLMAVITGDASLRRRPMARVTTPLGQCGARFVGRHGGRLPIAVVGTGEAQAIDYRLPVASAQVKSAVLLAGLNSPGITRVEEPEATRDHTERMLRYFGADVRWEDGEAGRVVSLVGQPTLRAANVRVPGDPSSAAFPLAAALVVPESEVRLTDLCLNPGRAGLIKTLREMGADIEIKNAHQENGEAVGDLFVRHGPLNGITVPASRAPSMIDEYPVLAALAAFAKGETRMLGLSELRVKESDRLIATAAALERCGVAVRVEGDELIVCGGNRVAGNGAMGEAIRTDLDHRIAMAFSVLGLGSKHGVLIDDAAPIATSFPDFVALMNGLGAAIETGE